MRGGKEKGDPLPHHRMGKVELIIGLATLAGFVGLIAWASSPCVGWKAPMQIVEWGSSGEGVGQFHFPYGIAINGSGQVHISDMFNNRVQVFTSTGRFVTMWGSNGTGEGQFLNPKGIAVNTTGHVYVVDYGNSRVQVFTSTGRFVTMWGSNGTGDGQFYKPETIAVNESGYVYVTDIYPIPYWHSRVQVFSPNGTFHFRWYLTEHGGGVAINSTGHVFVVSPYDQHVQIFFPNGTWIREWNTSFNPRNIAINSSGHVFLTEDIFSTIREGTPVHVFTSNGQADGGWSFCEEWGGVYGEYAVAVSSTGRIFVVDTDSDRIVVLYYPFERPPLDFWFIVVTVVLVVISAVIFLINRSQIYAAVRHLPSTLRNMQHPTKKEWDYFGVWCFINGILCTVGYPFRCYFSVTDLLIILLWPIVLWEMLAFPHDPREWIVENPWNFVIMYGPLIATCVFALVRLIVKRRRRKLHRGNPD